MDKLTFTTNHWAEFALKYAGGKQVESKFDPSGSQTMYSLTDDRVLFLNSRDAAKLDALQLAPGELVNAGRFERMEGRRRWTEFCVERVGAMEGAGSRGKTLAAPSTVTDPTLRAEAVPTLPIQPVNGETPRGAHPQAITAPPVAANHDAVLESCLIDAMTAAMRAEKAGQSLGCTMRFASEDVRAMALTLYIQRGKR
jgi:hypothetical protein